MIESAAISGLRAFFATMVVIGAIALVDPGSEPIEPPIVPTPSAAIAPTPSAATAITPVPPATFQPVPVPEPSPAVDPTSGPTSGPRPVFEPTPTAEPLLPDASATPGETGIGSR